jgi:hypothetical protein
MSGHRPPGAEFYAWRAIAVLIVVACTILIGMAGIAAYVEHRGDRAANHPISVR